jgi:Uma2 family endonuclease
MPVSEADYWEFYYLGYDVTYEWNNGILEEKGVSDYLTFRVFDWFIQLLIEFLRAQPIADRVALEMGFRLALPNKVAIRRPDYGVVRHDNPVLLAGPVQSYRGIFDLCIEGVSTSSKAMQERDTVVKKSEYAAGGVHEYYLLHHSPRLRRFYRLNAQGVYEPLPVGPGGLVRSEVLPGFQWRLGDLERQPSLEALIDDPVYQGYVLLNLQQERQRANQEQQRAEQEQQRAEQAELRVQQERAQVERLTAQLRALGIDPDAPSR